MPTSIPYNEIAFIICALLGGMMHYTKKFLRKETEVSLWQWFGKANWVTTFYTVVMFIFVTIGALAGGIINEHTDFWAVLYTGFITGFAVDAGFNSDKDITRQLIETRNDAHELFDKPDDEDMPAVPRVSRRERTDTDDFVAAVHNPQLDDRQAPKPADTVAAAEKPKRTRRKPVDGSPKVPPKPIDIA